MGIEVLDHIIIGFSDHVSMKNQGLIHSRVKDYTKLKNRWKWAKVAHAIRELIILVSAAIVAPSNTVSSCWVKHGILWIENFRVVSNFLALGAIAIDMPSISFWIASENNNFINIVS